MVVVGLVLAYTHRRRPASMFLAPFATENSNKGLSFRARGYSSGPIILTKVVLGKVYDTSAGTVRSCPPGYNSVGIYILTIT